MALTRLQAREEYIIGSVALFLDRNLKQAYDAEVATLPYNAPLTIKRGKPDDKSMALTVPRIMVDTVPASDKARVIEIGSNDMYRHLNFVFYCFPATVNGSPNVQAANLLKSYMRDAWGTSYVRLVDYNAVGAGPTNIIFCNDPAEVTNVGSPMDRKATTLLAEEMHRFDMHVSLRYPVTESYAT